MSIQDAIALGVPGEVIMEYLDDIKNAIQHNKAISGYEFDSYEDRIDYILDSCDMIRTELRLLKKK